MNIEELINSKESPLSDEQKEELGKEYFGLKNEIIKLGHEKVEQHHKIKELEGMGRRLLEDCAAYLTTVKAMLEYSNGQCATHRMRNFYAEAMIKYLQNIISSLKTSSFETEIPF